MKTLLLLFWEFLKIGLFSFGGGLGSIPFFKQAVLSNNWLTESEFYDFVGICESTPGPIYVNLATYVGTTIAGPIGGIVSSIAVILPAFIIMFVLATIMAKFLQNKIIKGAMKGLQPTVIGLIISAGFVLLMNISFVLPNSTELDTSSIGIFIFLVLTSITIKEKTGKKLSTVLMILVGAGLGILVGLM